VARTVERIPPLAHAALRRTAPAARSENSSTRSPAKHACVWQSTSPGIADSPRPSSSSTFSPAMAPRSRIARRQPTRPSSHSTYAFSTTSMSRSEPPRAARGSPRATRPARGRGSESR
jgi:hypothetical protein